MSGKRKIQLNLILEILMVFALIFIFTAKGEIHETLGYTLGILTVVHLILHWKQVKVMFKQF